MSQRVAYLCADPGIPPDGSKGASVHFRAMARGLQAHGVELDVVVARQGAVDGFAPHRARCVPAPRQNGLVSEVQQLAHATAIYDALQAAGPHTAIYERLSLFGLAGLMHARKLGVPLLVEVNAPLWLEAATFRGLGLRNTGRGVCLDVLQGAERVFTVSSALAHELIAQGVSAANVEVLGNGADLAAFRGAAPAPKPEPLRGRPTLMFVGSLKPWHGVEFLLRAFAALRAQEPCGLWVIGDGPLRADVQVAARAFPGDIVHQGAVDHARIPGLLQAADIVVVPYPRSAPDYFSPLKLVEALAAGRPLLCSRVPCVLETLQGHRPMGLFDADDVADFVVTARAVLDAGPAAGRVGIDQNLVDQLDWTTKAGRVAQLLPRSAATAGEVAHG